MRLLLLSMDCSLGSLIVSIVNIGVAGVIALYADTYSTAYTMTKLGLWMLSKSLAKELAPQQVRVNMVSPGLLDNAVDMPKDLSKLPMRRPGTVEDVAEQ